MGASGNHEIEIKFRVESVRGLNHQLRSGGFRVVTGRTHEMNTLYDLPKHPLRKRGALLRLRQYGPKWTLTYKDKAKVSSTRHKSRLELETGIENGPMMARILEGAGFTAMFAYEKFRTEWTDGGGHVLVDETPIGNFGEIEGPAEWIDRTARRLGIRQDDYITSSYAELFLKWKKRKKSKATQMLFKQV